MTTGDNVIQLTDVQICDVCGEAACTTCHPDEMTRCADDVRVHCSGCADDCGPCQDETVRERRAEQAEDIRLNGAI